MTASLRPSAASFLVCNKVQPGSRIVVNGLLLDAPLKSDAGCVSLAEDPWAEIINSDVLGLKPLNGVAGGRSLQLQRVSGNSAVESKQKRPLINGKHNLSLHRSPDAIPSAEDSPVPEVGLAAVGEEDPFLALAELSSTTTTAASDHAVVEVERLRTLLRPDFRFFPRRKVFPREEPWLLESIFLRESEEQTAAAATAEGQDVAVEIFINSSDCTMQRIAIVENKKLVQLLLEPINSSFQVGDVYLGVVKRLLPGMNGIFVDVGTPRNALLEVNMRQFPHILHPAANPGTPTSRLYGVEDEDAGESKPASLLRRIAAWRKVKKGMMMIVQVKKEALRQKGPQLTAGICLAGRYWVLSPEVCSADVGVSRKIIGLEKSRLKRLAKEMQPAGFGVTVRSEAAGRSREELEKDLGRLLESWDQILKRAEVAVAAVKKDPVPVLLQRAMGQTLRLVRDGFTNKVERFVVDSAHTYDEVTGYLHVVAPHLSDRVELYTGKQPIFDAFHLEAEVEKSCSSRVELPNGAYLVMEETEALVSIDVNGGVATLGKGASQRDAVLAINLAAARQIATELRLRDIGGIIVVDFIDMEEPGDERLVFEEMRKAIERDRSKVIISEISEFGLMELTRARDRPSVTSRVTNSCPCCGGSGRVESLEMTVSKIERAIKRILARRRNAPPKSSKWPAMELRVDPATGAYLKSRGGRRVNQLASALNILLTLKASRFIHKVSSNWVVVKNRLLLIFLGDNFKSLMTTRPVPATS